MGKSDKQLGMDRAITRRDFVNGALVAGAKAMQESAIDQAHRAISELKGII